MEFPSEVAGGEQHFVSSVSRAGARWSAAEYAALVEEIRRGLTLEEIATAHGRPPGGITAACNRLLPPEQRPPSRDRAMAALSLYLDNHPDESLKPTPAKSACSRLSVACTPPPEPTRGISAVAELDLGDAAILVSEAIAWLQGKPRERQILRMRAGLGHAPHTLAEIGERFNLSRERIRQIQEKALARLMRQARKPGTPGAALALLLDLPSAAALDETFAERIAAIVTSEFESPAGVAIPTVLCAAGVAVPTARRVVALARAAEKRRREFEAERRRAAAVEDRANTVVARWSEHASWPTAIGSPPQREAIRALRLTGPGEAVGSFYSLKLGRDVLYESGLEFAALTILENSTDIAWYQEQPLTVPYTWAESKRVYFPDILAVTHTERCVLIEVKPLTSMPVALNRAKAAAGRAYAHRHGWGWVTVDGMRTERDLETRVIPAGTQRAIAAELAAHRHLTWRQVLELRTTFGASSHDIAAFIIQTGAQLILEPSYRITAASP